MIPDGKLGWYNKRLESTRNDNIMGKYISLKDDV